MSPEQNQDIYIDIERISQELRIRPHIYVKLTKSFANSLGGKMNLLNDALMANDRDQMRMILHEIKGTAGNLRLYTITGPEAVLHAAVKAGEPQKILSAHLDILRSETEKLQKYVNRWPDDYGEKYV